jgi:hypothetical protein
MGDVKNVVHAAKACDMDHLCRAIRKFPEKKNWVNSLNFGCHLLQNSLLGNIYSNPIVFLHASKAP